MTSTPLLPYHAAKKISVLGFDVGERYLAWSEVGVYIPRRLRREVVDYLEVIDDWRLWRLRRCGFVRLPTKPSNFCYGLDLQPISQTLDVLVNFEIRATFTAAERYTHRPGAGGAKAELINLRLGSVTRDSGGFLVRNTDWKNWLKSTEEDGKGKDATEIARSRFLTSSPHEADATGIALYTGCVLLRKRLLEGWF